MASRSKAKEEDPEARGELVEIESAPSNWEFIDRVPTTDEVKQLLRLLPEWWGVQPADFWEYVQGLPADKKIKVKERTPSGGVRSVDRWFSVITLYFSVAGRIQMVNRAQELHGWRVDFVPEPTTPTGVPGYLQMDDRLVYREYAEIWAPVGASQQRWVEAAQAAARDQNQAAGGPAAQLPPAEFPPPGMAPLGSVQWRDGQKFELLGRRSGTAWVPATGGKQAAGSNPYEKVETAARGRALAGWGFGVLPGSGVASLEEMLGSPANQAAQAAAGAEGAGAGGDARAGEGTQETAEQLAENLLDLAEECRQLLGHDNERWGIQMVRRHFLETRQIDVATAMDEDGTVLEIDLSNVKHGQLLLTRNAFRKRRDGLKRELARQQFAEE